LRSLGVKEIKNYARIESQFNSPIAIYLDVESTYEQEAVYLIGMIVVGFRDGVFAPGIDKLWALWQRLIYAGEKAEGIVMVRKQRRN
jgi:hypothetical protein